MYKHSIANKRSRFVSGGQTEYDATTLGWWSPSTYHKNSNDYDITITPQLAMRPDIIAYIGYGTPLLSWLVLLYNDIINPLDLTEGRVIRLPSPDSVLTKIL